MHKKLLTKFSIHLRLKKIQQSGYRGTILQHNTVRPLLANLLVVNFQRLQICVCMSSHVSYFMSGTHCHVCASSTSGCAFVYVTGQDCMQCRTVSLFQAQDVQKQKGRQNWIQQGIRTCAIHVRHEWNHNLPSISYCRGPLALPSPTSYPSSRQ